mmetsp:Transcript_105985/g.187722  ORF Transcript_105985/g.187722 Transcript_105985/m.187722 type:complete len:367 (-) Transcript_105985:42-1142(-)
MASHRVETQTEAEDALHEALTQSITELTDALRRRIIEAGRHDIQILREAWESEKIRQQKEIERQWAQLRAKQEALNNEREVHEQERQRMNAGNGPSDILTLNIGGEKVVQRRRSTLCAVKDSMLEARFSGRWDQQLDKDDEGRHFINYPPSVFLPFLNYLSMKEAEDPHQPVPLPEIPEEEKALFEAMLRFFGLEWLSCPRTIDGILTPYNLDMGSNSCGLIFEIRAKSRSLQVLAIETSSKEGNPSVVLKTAQCSLAQLPERPAEVWTEVGSGWLQKNNASRIGLTQPIFLQAEGVCCIRISLTSAGTLAYNDKGQGWISAENEDLQISTGRAASRSFADNNVQHAPWRAFNGKLEYEFRGRPRT